LILELGIHFITLIVTSKPTGRVLLMAGTETPTLTYASRLDGKLLVQARLKPKPGLVSAKTEIANIRWSLPRFTIPRV